ncbi:hypothetical protein BH09BAC2_BH09BAC2_20730 [soil metagenome]
MKNLLAGIVALIVIMFAAGSISSCKKEFDQPPVQIDTSVIGNITIKNLKALPGVSVSGSYTLIPAKTIIEGVVTANDKSGNLFKQIYIQDATGGIGIDLDAYNLYTNFPVGRKVAIEVGGLYMVNQSNMVKISGRTLANGVYSTIGVPSALIDKITHRGTFDNPVVPKIVTVSQLTPDLQGSLIQLNNFEVSPSDLNFTWGDISANKNSQNINLQNCASPISKIIVRSSGYANFAGVTVPQGNGSIVAIYTVFSTTKQLLIRDTSDVQFNDLRCSAGGGTGATLISIAQLRAMTTGTLGSFKITGTVTSDPASKNLSAGNLFIQDGTAGIDLYFGSTAPTTNLAVGDSVMVDISGGNLTLFNGLLEVSLASSALPTAKLAIGKTVTPVIATIAQLNAGYANYEGKLVKILCAAATPTGTYSGSKTLNDGTGTITMFNQTASTFATTTMPTGNMDWVGIASKFTSPQLVIRNTSDVTTGTCTVTPAAPTVTTTTATSIAQTTATAGGNVTAAGTQAVTARGVVWSTTTNPDITLSTKTSDGTGTGSYTSSITGLTANTLYHYRAYATNSVGTSYGADQTFTTTTTPPTPTAPVVTTTAATAITQTTATSGGNVTSDGGASVTARGVVWSTSANPDITLSTKTSDGTGTGTFPSSITGLTANTLYHVRAYATNSVGTSYGADVTFTSASAGGSTTPFTATYDFALVTTTSGTTDPSAVPTVTGLTFGSFTTTMNGNSSGGGRFSFGNTTVTWPGGATNADDINFTGALDATKYYQVTITPTAGTQLDITKLTFTFQRSGTGVRMAALRGSVDGYTTNLPASINPANTNLSVISYGGMSNVIFYTLDANSNAQDGSTITLPASYSNVTSAITLRFYGFNAESSGTFSIDNVVITGATH